MSHLSTITTTTNSTGHHHHHQPPTRASLMFIKEKLYQRSLRMNALSCSSSSASSSVSTKSSTGSDIEPRRPESIGSPGSNASNDIGSANVGGGGDDCGGGGHSASRLAFGVENILSQRVSPTSAAAAANFPASMTVGGGGGVRDVVSCYMATEGEEAHKFCSPAGAAGSLLGIAGSGGNNNYTNTPGGDAFNATALYHSALTAAYYSNLSKSSLQWSAFAANNKSASSAMLEEINRAGGGGSFATTIGNINNNNNTSSSSSLYHYGLPPYMYPSMAAYPSAAAGTIFDPLSLFMPSSTTAGGGASHHNDNKEQQQQQQQALRMKPSSEEVAKPSPGGLSSSSSTGATATAATTAANGCSNRKRTWSRAVFTGQQRRGLESRFLKQKYITKPDRKQLAAALGLSDAQVKVWFQVGDLFVELFFPLNFELFI